MATSREIVTLDQRPVYLRPQGTPISVHVIGPGPVTYTQTPYPDDPRTGNMIPGYIETIAVGSTEEFTEPVWIVGYMTRVVIES